MPSAWSQKGKLAEARAEDIVRRRYVLIGCLFFLVVQSVLFASAAAAPSLVSPPIQGISTQSSDCNGLDIVLLIDQSGSMGGVKGVAPNDPDNFRIDSAKQVLEQLGQNRLYFCTNAIHRLAVISFGDGPNKGDGWEMDLPFTVIDPDPAAGPQAWQTTADELKKAIVPKSLGTTDFAAAFAQAKRMLDELGSIGNLPRKKSLILLTDGGPCVEELGCKSSSNTFAPTPYLRDLRDQINNDFPFTDGAGYYLWVVAMQARGAKYLEGKFESGTLADYWAALAQARGGDLVRLSRNQEEIPATFFTILVSVLGNKAEVVDCGPNYIDPYTETVIYTFFKGQSDIVVKLEHKYADGTLLTLSDGKVVNGPPDFKLENGNVDSHIDCEISQWIGIIRDFFRLFIQRFIRFIE